MATTYAQPVKALHQHVKELEAALTVCLANPGKKPVHKLRSSTRRIGALLQLLRHVDGLPPHTKEVRALSRELRGVRRAAGAVRDLDVHEELLREFLHPRSRSQEAHALQADAQKMRDEQESRRAKRADDLRDVLQERAGHIAAALEAVVKALKPAEELRLTAQQLTDAVSVDFAAMLKRLKLREHLGAGEVQPRNSAAAVRRSKRDKPAKQKAKGHGSKLTDERLHDLRKAAKAARYMAESAEGSRRAAMLARQFEAIQESGGRWHDWLELTAETRETLGRKHPLTEILKQRRATHRAGFLVSIERHMEKLALG